MEHYHQCLQPLGKINLQYVVLVPTVGISPVGVRLGYGHGFYDKFLAEHKTATISLTLEKQIVKNIPKSEHDIIINWIITEDRILET